MKTENEIEQERVERVFEQQQNILGLTLTGDPNKKHPVIRIEDGDYEGMICSDTDDLKQCIQSEWECIDDTDEEEKTISITYTWMTEKDIIELPEWEP